LIGRGVASKVFKVSKRKKIKSILSEDLENNNSLVGGEITIGMNVSQYSKYLVCYYGVISQGDYVYIIMDYFPNGDIQSYLSKGNKFKESV
jgi:serine/threonine protein kinase